ncbi:MAG: agmatine deiminase family protein, partial [Pseudomonadota bacterium]
ACFAGPGHVLLNMPSDEEDANFAVGQDALSRLMRAEDAKGREIKITKVPQPKPIFEAGRRLSASYINFYLAGSEDQGGAVIMPSFGQSADDEAAKIINAAFPGRDLVQMPALDIIRGGGGIHCITQPQPAPPAVAGETEVQGETR